VLGRVLQVLAQAKVLLADVDFAFNECVIAARREEFALIEKIYATETLPFIVRLVEGGETRQQSVRNAVESIAAEWVMIHDAARPLASPALFVAVCEAARRHGGALAALPASDTVKYAASGEGSPYVKSTFERDRVWLAQTPQVFSRRLFGQALQSAEQIDFEGTDCASLVERMGQKVALVSGESRNFKITYPQDLARAEYLLKENSTG